MIALIRHGKTQGNLEGRYVGRTDEGLSGEGIAQWRECAYPAVSRVYASPMRRCVETARILYPNMEPVLVPDFREIDFGDFEYRTYAELNGNPAYQAWIDSNGTRPFPNGESQAAFIARCASAFFDLIEEIRDKDVAIIAHGGTIMAILAAYAVPKRDYFDYQVKNGHGYIAALSETGMELHIGCKLAVRESEAP